jgi:hypothetical protein
LNNILEQDHRAIQRRVKAKQNWREFQARRTIEGYEAMHMIRKELARWVSGVDVRKQNQFIDKLFDLPASHLDTEFISGRFASPFSKLHNFLGDALVNHSTDKVQ